MEEEEVGEKRLIKLTIYDNDKIIESCEGFNQLTISHMVFKSNAGLQEPKEEEPLKPTTPKSQMEIEEQETEDITVEKFHKYLIECSFDLNEWPQCTSKNEQTQNLGWVLKIFGTGKFKFALIS
jgi:hypothetical protein